MLRIIHLTPSHTISRLGRAFNKAAERAELFCCFLQQLSMNRLHPGIPGIQSIQEPKQSKQLTGQPAEDQDMNMSAPQMHGTFETVESTEAPCGSLWTFVDHSHGDQPLLSPM